MQRTQQRTLETIAAQGMRPAENGVGMSAERAGKFDISKLSRAKMEELERRSARGERITRRRCLNKEDNHGQEPLRLNLQLFATTMTTETGSLSAEMKTFYEKRLLDQAEPLLVHNQFGDKYPIPAGSGKKIEFRKYSALPKALTALTEGVTPGGQQPDRDHGGGHGEAVRRLDSALRHAADDGH